MDGGQERFTGYKEQPRPLATQVPLDTLPAKLPPDNLYEPEAPPQQPGEVPTLKQNTLCGQVLAAFPQYRGLNRLRRDRPSLNLSGHYSQREELCDGCWRSSDSRLRAFVLEMHQKWRQGLPTQLLPHC